MHKKLWRLITAGNLSATAVVLIAAVPLIFVISQSTQMEDGSWAWLWSKVWPHDNEQGLLTNTIQLSILVGIGCFALGVTAAWLITRREFYGRRVAIWLMILPLTIPTYVFAHIYTSLFDEDGWLGQLWQFIFGADSTVPELSNIFGTAFVLSLAGFSYVFLLVSDALTRSRRDIEEAARVHGYTHRQVFWKISLPMLRPAIAAGMALVVLHVLSDFGAVKMLGFKTFTTDIYLQLDFHNDWPSAAALSLVLVSLSLTFLILERFFRNRQRYYGSSQSKKAQRLVATGSEKIMIWTWLGLISLLAFVLPVLWLLSYTWDAVSKSIVDVNLWQYTKNSLMISVSAATLATIAALPVALFQAKYRNGLSQAYVHISSLGFVLPGPVIALGILAFVIATIDGIYGTVFVLILAMVIRFLPLSVQAQEAAVQQLTPSLAEAGRSLGASSFENLRRVVLPFLRNGMLSAWVLVFIDTLKELPATMLLRPTGFDTLPVRIWLEASEENLELAAPPALMLIIGTLPVLWLLLRQHDGDRN